MAVLRGLLIRGLLVTVPLLVTFALLRWVFRVLDSVLQPVFRWLFDNNVPGAGLVGGLVVILLVGLLVSTWPGRVALHALESLLFRTPLLRTIYGGTKQVAEVVLGGRQAPFRRVVLVEWPRRGAYALGFVTGEEAVSEGRSVLKVFVISAPNPTTGFLMLVPEEQTVPLRMTVDEALTLVVSGGLAGSAQAVVQALAEAQADAEGGDR
ncbi:MAG: DUF502 domain-containing protein [Armatimonadota bacterium]|nr:DUF502 domain-containing protein [Armatimonadota bacterium]